MSKPVNDVRASSHDARTENLVGYSALNWRAEIAAEREYLPIRDIRAPAGMTGDRAAIQGFLRLLPENPLQQSRGAPFSVLSAELSTLTAEENANLTDALQLRLQVSGFQFGPVEGCYKGTREAAFAVITPTYLDRMTVDSLARKYQQESVLHVDSDRTAQLFFLDTGTHGDAQRWAQVTEDHATARDAWTRDQFGNYYMLQPIASKSTVGYAIARGWL